jgi:hypothetical protein
MLLPKFDEGAYQPSLRLEHKGLNICLNIYKKTGTWKGDVYMWKLTNSGPNDMKRLQVDSQNLKTWNASGLFWRQTLPFHVKPWIVDVLGAGYSSDEALFAHFDDGQLVIGNTPGVGHAQWPNADSSEVREWCFRFRSQGPIQTVAS